MKFYSDPKLQLEHERNLALGKIADAIYKLAQAQCLEGAGRCPETVRRPASNSEEEFSCESYAEHREEPIGGNT